MLPPVFFVEIPTLQHGKYKYFLMFWTESKPSAKIEDFGEKIMRVFIA
jgi:hypothetical protein